MRAVITIKRLIQAQSRQIVGMNHPYPFAAQRHNMRFHRRHPKRQRTIHRTILNKNYRIKSIHSHHRRHLHQNHHRAHSQQY